MTSSAAVPARPRRRWRQDPEGRRARILDAAVAAFARDGYRATRVAAIAREARVSEGAVYAYFPSKRALLTAVGERYGRGLARAAFDAIGGELDVGGIGRMVRSIFRYVRETDGSLAAFLLTHNPEEGGPAQSANRAAMLAAIEERLRAALSQGRVAPLNPRVAAELQFGLVETALRDCFLRNRGREQESYIEEVTRVLSAALRRPEDPTIPPAPAPPR